MRLETGLEVLLPPCPQRGVLLGLFVPPGVYHPHMIAWLTTPSIHPAQVPGHFPTVESWESRKLMVLRDSWFPLFPLLNTQTCDLASTPISVLCHMKVGISYERGTAVIQVHYHVITL